MQPDLSPPPPSTRAALLRWLGPATLLLWLLLALFWLLDIAGVFGAATTVGRALLPLAGLAALTLAGRQVALLLAAGRRLDGALLLAVLLLAVVVGFTGLAHEVGKGYYTDEGHYLQHARRLLAGDLFVRTMIYPHLLYHLDAFALWLAALYPGLSTALTTSLYGVGAGPAFDWMVLRLVTASLGVATVLPVFLVARRLAGRLAALLASGAMIFSTHYHDGFHVNICDVPSATFAAFCLLVVERLLRRESQRGYLVAGALAGLAAAAKYPAGLVATAIVGVWVIQRWRRRTWHSGLLGAGLVAIAVFLSCNPSLFVYPQETLWGERGIFFGVRQYGQGGWIGVTPSSNTLFYLAQLAFNFSWPALALALPGVALLDAEPRRRLLALAPFPLLYLLLISSMSMVVVRNLFPVIPALAIFLGVALAAWWPWLVALWQKRQWRWAVGGPRLAMAALLALALLPPMLRTGQQALSMARPSTRERMSDWMLSNVPRGAGILKESYTPDFAPVWFGTAEQRFVLRFPAELFDDPSFDFVLLADQAHGRFFRPENQTEGQARWYEDLFARHSLVHEEAPSWWRRGPRLMLYRLIQPGEPASEQSFTAADAFLPNAAMLEGQSLSFARQGQFALFRARLAAGSYTLTLQGEVRGGRLEVRDLANQVVSDSPLEEGRAALGRAALGRAALGRAALGRAALGRAALGWPTAGKAFLYLYLDAGSRIDRAWIAPLSPPPDERAAPPPTDDPADPS